MFLGALQTYRKALGRKPTQEETDRRLKRTRQQRVNLNNTHCNMTQISCLLT